MFDQAVELLEKDTNYTLISSDDNQVVFENDAKQRYLTIRKIPTSINHIQFLVDSEDYFYDKTINDLNIVKRLKNV